ncbi:hypothetical protein HOY82DRAFT_543486 [Tuber indicum]|nr:hypothetical protein HOY82DRAFT_543486 [Tuber indicum]
MSAPSGLWAPYEVAYLLFYTAHGLTHQSIATLLGLYASVPSGRRARTLDAVRSKVKELRTTLGLCDNDGTISSERVLQCLTLYLQEHGLAEPNPNRELTATEMSHVEAGLPRDSTWARRAGVVVRGGLRDRAGWALRYLGGTTFMLLDSDHAAQG